MQNRAAVWLLSAIFLAALGGDVIAAVNGYKLSRERSEADRQMDFIRSSVQNWTRVIEDDRERQHRRNLGQTKINLLLESEIERVERALAQKPVNEVKRIEDELAKADRRK